MNTESKQKTRTFKNKIGLLIGIFVVCIGIGILIVIIPFLKLGIGTSPTLIVLINENEARPCGGFLTAYGVVQLFPPQFEISDIYALKDHDFGVSSFPITQVSEKQYFWDLGTSTNKYECSKTLTDAYNHISSTPVTQTILVPFASIEKLLNPLFPLILDGESVDQSNFFSFFSRKAADVDRHDEEALQGRKSPMKILAKESIKKVLTHPTALFSVWKKSQEMIQSEEIFTPHASQNSKETSPELRIVEWNLGGGKSSRYLQKKLTMRITETSPQLWNINITFTAQNHSQNDAPLGQDWKGVFSVQFPDFLSLTSEEISAHIPTNGVFETKWYTTYRGNLPSLSIRTNAYQSLFADISVSAFPQQTIHSHTLNTKEHFGVFWGQIYEYQALDWNITKDQIPPFITRHTIIPINIIDGALENETKKAQFKENSLFVELHFNEEINIIQPLRTQLIDTQWENEQEEHLSHTQYHLLSDKKTLLLAFPSTIKQKNERYKIQVENIEDLFGNRLITKPRTVIDRTE